MMQTVMVIGPMRSGTTFAAQLLGSHRTAHYLGFELSEQWAAWTGVPFGAPGANHRRCPPLQDQDVTEAQRETLHDGLSRRLAAEVEHRPTVLVLKNPHLWHRLDFVRTLLPGVRFVRTRRDPLQVVASLRRLFHRSLDQHGHVHHLPRQRDHCWEYTPADEADVHDPRRTFPGGDPAVLADYVARVEHTLDAGLEGASDLAATITHHEVVTELAACTRRLRRQLALGPGHLRPPEPIDPSRARDHRQLLQGGDRDRAKSALTRHGLSTSNI